MQTHQTERAELLLKKSQQGREDGGEWVHLNYTENIFWWLQHNSTHRSAVHKRNTTVITFQFKLIHLVQCKSHNILFPSLQYVLRWDICVQDYKQQWIVSQSHSGLTTSVGSVAVATWVKCSVEINAEGELFIILYFHISVNMWRILRHSQKAVKVTSEQKFHDN